MKLSSLLLLTLLFSNFLHVIECRADAGDVYPVPRYGTSPRKLTVDGCMLQAHYRWNNSTNLVFDVSEVDDSAVSNPNGYQQTMFFPVTEAQAVSYLATDLAPADESALKAQKTSNPGGSIFLVIVNAKNTSAGITSSRLSRHLVFTVPYGTSKWYNFATDRASYSLVHTCIKPYPTPSPAA